MRARFISSLIVPCTIAFFPQQASAGHVLDSASPRIGFPIPAVDGNVGPPTYRRLYAYDFDPPTWEFLDNIIFQDSLGWTLNVYISGSLHDVTLLSGSYSSGNWSAEGFYSFSNRMIRGRFSGSVIFRFTDGRLRCLEYSDAGGVCRRSYDQ